MTVDNDNEVRPLPGSGWLCLPGGPWWSLPCLIFTMWQNKLTQPALSPTVKIFWPNCSAPSFKNTSKHFESKTMMMLEHVRSSHRITNCPRAITEIVIYVKQTQKLPNLNNYVSSALMVPVPYGRCHVRRLRRKLLFFLRVHNNLLLPAAAW